MITESLLIWAIVCIGGGLLLALLMLAGHGAVRLALERLYAPRVRRARAALVAAVDRGRPDAETRAALSALSAERRLALFEAFAPSLAGPEKEALQAAARELGVLEGAERRCSSRNWRRRLHGARVLSLLGGGGEAVPPLLHDERPEVRAQAAEWASAHPDPAIVARLVEMLPDPRPFTRYTVMDSLIRLGAAAAGPLAQAIRDGAGAPALEVAARIATPELAEAAATRAGDPDPAVRAWVARVLAAVGGEARAELATGLLEDADSEVRAAAAVALGRLGQWPAAPALAAALRDPAWRVRRDAAVALRTLGGPGRMMLERALRDEDAFARDMARQTLDMPEVALPS
jgi:HEAT repeat protein